MHPSDAFFVQPTSDAERASDKRARACSRPHADHRLPPALAARPRPRARGYPRRRPRHSPVAMCGSAAERPTHRTRRRHAPSRQAMGRCTAHACRARPSHGRRAPAPPMMPTMPIMPIMRCRQGRSVRHAQRTAQLEIRRAVRARGGAAALRRQRRGAFLFAPLMPDYPYPYSPDYPYRYSSESPYPNFSEYPYPYFSEYPYPYSSNDPYWLFPLICTCLSIS